MHDKEDVKHQNSETAVQGIRQAAFPEEFGLARLADDTVVKQTRGLFIW